VEKLLGCTKTGCIALPENIVAPIRKEKYAARQKTKFFCVAKSFDGSTYFDIIAPQLETVQSKPLLQPVNAIR
jgi:hypothetical protein